MLEGKRQPPDNLEIEAGPQFDRSLVCADYEVELHRAKATFPGSLQRMLAHLARYTAALRGGPSDVAAIRHVSTPTLLVRFQEICPYHHAVFFPHKGLFIRGKPVFDRLLLAHVARKGVGLTAANHLFENLPN